MLPRVMNLQAIHHFIRFENKEFLSLASTPNDESCTHAGDHFADQQAECKALINQLRRVYGPEPGGAEFIIIENYHDFGIYYEAGIIYDYMDEENEDTFGEEETPAQIYAMKCEHIPDLWDDEAPADLRTFGHSNYQPAKVINIKRA